MTIPDPLPALRAFVAADAAVIVLAGTRVFAEELPKAEADLQPRSTVLIESAGGGSSRDFVRLSRTGIDVRTYGVTPFHAMKLHLAVHEALKHLERVVQTPGPVLLHSVVVLGGPLALRDPNASWPFVFRSYELLAAETAA